VTKTDGGTEDRGRVTVGSWSSPLEGTYEDSLATTTEQARDVATTGPEPRVSLTRARRVSLTKPRRVSLVKAARDPRSRWAQFAPRPPRAPGPVMRLVTRVARVVGHEWSLAVLGALGLAVVMTWPALRDPTRTLPNELDAPATDAHRLAWIGHAISSDPGALGSDRLLGYAPFSLFGTGVDAAVLRFNVVYVLAFALAFLGGFALARQLGATRAGAAVAAAAVAFAPWRWGPGGHLDVLSTGGVALALAMLARGHGLTLRRHDVRPPVRPVWAIAGWLLAAWQLSLGYSIGLPFLYALAGVVVVAAVALLLTRTRIALLVFAVDLVGAGLVAAAWIASTIAFPQTGTTRADLTATSAPPHGFVVGPAGSWLWGNRHAGLRADLAAPAEGALLLGYVLFGLAVTGLVFSVWSLHVRLLLFIGLAASAVLATGTRAPFRGELTYLLLHDYLPGWNAVDTPRHLVGWTTLFAALLAAGAVSALVVRVDRFVAGRVPGRPGVLLQTAMVLPVALVVIEGIPAVDRYPVPRAPAALAAAEPPVVVLPAGPGHDGLARLWSVNGFPEIANNDAVAETLVNFPDDASIRLLGDLGVRTVVVVKAEVEGTPFQGVLDADADRFGVSRDETDDAIVFRLSAAG
jgi:hypothetical protein